MISNKKLFQIDLLSPEWLIMLGHKLDLIKTMYFLFFLQSLYMFIRHICIFLAVSCKAKLSKDFLISSKTLLLGAIKNRTLSIFRSNFSGQKFIWSSWKWYIHINNSYKVQIKTYEIFYLYCKNSSEDKILDFFRFMSHLPLWDCCTSLNGKRNCQCDL